jgi:hypothetical protein
MLVGSLLVAVLISALPRGSCAQSEGASTVTGTSRAFNPAISLNSLFLGQLDSGRAEAEEGPPTTDGHVHEHAMEGLDVQEVELRFTADIDPYSKADATLAFHGEEIHFEELFISSSVLPWGLGLEAGKMYLPFSRENTVHTHQLPFVQRSLHQQALFAEGYSDVGIEVSSLLPAPFFLELRAGAFDGSDEEQAWFGSEDGEDLAYLGGVSALWDLGESTTFAIDTSGVLGRNPHGDDTYSRIGSITATLRWKPTRRTIYRSFRLASEYVSADKDADEAGEDLFLSGWTSYAQLQFARRWWIQARHDQLDPSLESENSHRTGALIAFVPSEFQSLRAEVSFVHTPADDFTEFLLQYNFTIGSHPAHRY